MSRWGRRNSGFQRKNDRWSRSFDPASLGYVHEGRSDFDEASRDWTRRDPDWSRGGIGGSGWTRRGWPRSGSLAGRDPGMSHPLQALDRTLEDVSNALDNPMAPGAAERAQLGLAEAQAILSELARMAPVYDDVVGQYDPLGDGRYDLVGQAFEMDLRIDVGHLQIVSGDVFPRGHRRGGPCLATFRTVPGLDLRTTAGDLPIVAETPSGHHARGILSLDVGRYSGQVSAVLSFDTALEQVPGHRVLEFVGQKSSDAYRLLGLEIEREAHVVEPESVTHRGEDVTLGSIFFNAGIDLVEVSGSDQIPALPQYYDGWSDGDLYAIMSHFADRNLDRQDWSLSLLSLSRHRMQGLLGVMFDLGGTADNRLPRQAAAVFRHSIQGRQGISSDGKWLQTTAHEIAHALNLAHRFERPVGRADSTSIMNYDWCYRGGNQATEYWRRFSFQFDADELAFLRHGPHWHVIPGGSAFHSVAYWRNTGGGYVPYRHEVAFDGLSLSLSAGGDHRFPLAAPIMLSVTLASTGPVVDLPTRILDPKVGLLELVVRPRKDRIGRAISDPWVFRPLMHRCVADASSGGSTHRLTPSAPLTDNVNLTFGAAGFTFPEPGMYEVVAVLALPTIGGQADLVVRSQPLAIVVEFPTRAGEEIVSEVFDADVGVAVALGGSAVLGAALNKIKGVVDKCQPKKTGKSVGVYDSRYNILFARTVGLYYARPRIYRSDDQDLVFDDKNTEESIKYLRIAVQADGAKQVFDGSTLAATTTLLDAQEQAAG